MSASLPGGILAHHVAVHSNVPKVLRRTIGQVVGPCPGDGLLSLRALRYRTAEGDGMLKTYYFKDKGSLKRKLSNQCYFDENEELYVRRALKEPRVELSLEHRLGRFLHQHNSTSVPVGHPLENRNTFTSNEETYSEYRHTV